MVTIVPEYSPERARVNAQYELDCVDCQFQMVVVGEFETVLEEIQAHQRERNAGPAEHFVNVRLRD